MKNQVRMNKYEPLVQEVELIKANPDYVHVKLADGRDTTVSTRHLAPKGETTKLADEWNTEENILVDLDVQSVNSDSAITSADVTEKNLDTLSLCPVRHRQPPAYLKDYVRDWSNYKIKSAGECDIILVCNMAAHGLLTM